MLPVFMPIEKLRDVFQGCPMTVNHVGVNFFSDLMEEKEYKSFRSIIARESAMYRYPTGKEWPFIVPVTQEEYQSEITDFTTDRNPKFEIVYSSFHKTPLLQFDIDIPLTRQETFERLPKPYGISYQGAENYTRAVFVDHPWKNILLRFDFRFRDDFYPWLVQEGGRIK
jgi:hypothetical protein